MFDMFTSIFAKPKPPQWASNDAADIDDEEDADDLPNGDRAADEGADICGQSFNIEYVSSAGEISERCISVIRTIEQSGNISLFAYCFVKERPRQFRLDRVQAVYDAEGVSRDCEKFFNGYGLAYKKTAPPKKQPGKFLKQKYKHPAIVLVALARIDGEYRQSELDEILSYAVKSAENMGKFQSDDDIDAFEEYLKNLYPSAPVLKRSLAAISKHTFRAKTDFLRMCVRVMDADGIQKTSEFDMIMDIKRMIGLTS
ncbi:WYL domain-containing protein [Paremcibacter congregatus]|uniref:WYL domain-containing protein n=1 Tax=Paremcibacter congregatus TaxID=2043170 RepID=UPI0030EC8524|tara:strand:+ start:3690 stop:4457 length:768 start_codon:yes stop_codon:yes gene_type:complete